VEVNDMRVRLQRGTDYIGVRGPMLIFTTAQKANVADVVRQPDGRYLATFLSGQHLQLTPQGEWKVSPNTGDHELFWLLETPHGLVLYRLEGGSVVGAIGVQEVAP
jgi:hypothetical protein